MKNLYPKFRWSSLAKTAGTYLAACVTVAVIGLAASNLLNRAHAEPRRENRKEELEEIKALLHNAQVAELYELQAAFHAAASHGGDIDAMMALWAEDSSITVGGVVYSGKDGVRDFFANHSGAFKHDWVSLAPSFKTQFDIHGETADIFFECHYADPSATPYVIRSDISAAGTAKKVHGRWLFWNIVAGAAPL